jgi:hypothetical protein
VFDISTPLLKISRNSTDTSFREQQLKDFGVLPQAIDYQELPFHKKAVSDNGFCVTGSHEFCEVGS